MTSLMTKPKERVPVVVVLMSSEDFFSYRSLPSCDWGIFIFKCTRKRKRDYIYRWIRKPHVCTLLYYWECHVATTYWRRHLRASGSWWVETFARCRQPQGGLKKEGKMDRTQYRSTLSFQHHTHLIVENQPPCSNTKVTSIKQKQHLKFPRRLSQGSLRGCRFYYMRDWPAQQHPSRVKSHHNNKSFSISHFPAGDKFNVFWHKHSTHSMNVD